MKKEKNKSIFVIITLFLFIHLFGLALLASEISFTFVDDEPTIAYPQTAIGERPEFQQTYDPLWFILLGVGLGTLLLLGLMRTKKLRFVWKYWYALAIIMASTITLGVFLPSLVAFLLASLLVLAKFKYWQLHNVVELLIYPGLALLLVPLFTLPVVVILLLVISVYDMYAVWKSKHMVLLAKESMKQNIFPGLVIGKPQPLVSSKSGKKKAILGGGDVLFTLLFSGVAFNHYVLLTSFSQAFFLAIIVSVFATLGLVALYLLGSQKKFYPAMPFLTVSCLLGFAFTLLL